MCGVSGVRPLILLLEVGSRQDKYGNIINCLQEDRIKLPAKTQPERLTCGVSRPPLAPFATDLLWYTAWWVLMSDGRCRGMVGRFALVCGPPLLMFTQDTIVYDFYLCIHHVFVLFRTCAPEIINSKIGAKVSDTNMRVRGIVFLLY